VALLCAAVLGCDGSDARDGEAVAGEQPHLIVVQTDDQTAASMSRERMPNLFAALDAGGVRFGAYIATTPLCCPSRASLLTGQYAHNHGIHSNRPGYPHLRQRANVLPVWLQRAGYRTAHVGKFLHGLRLVRNGAEPPGWDDWIVQPHPPAYFDYELEENGSRVRYGTNRRDYLTRVLNRKATRIVRDHATGPQPLFLELDHYAPHHSSRERGKTCATAAEPDPDDRERVGLELLPEQPSLNERDLSDKPEFMSHLEPIGDRRLQETAETQRCDLASLRAADRGIGSLVRALDEAGELDRTVLVFTSDNGYLYGEHRISGGKGRPYEPSIRVPLVIAGPAEIVGDDARTIDHVTANIDLAPTLLELAGAEPCRAPGQCRTLDGRSLVPLLQDDDSSWPADRAVVVESLGSGNRNRVGSIGRSCSWAGLRGPGFVYLEHDRVPHPNSMPERPRCVDGSEVELYDLERDPDQLESKVTRPLDPDEEDLVAGYAERLRALRDCSGSSDAPEPAANACE
jgi:arylsulfatase A-like enzyme